MESDGIAHDGGGQNFERGVERDFAGLVPEPGLGVLVPGEPGDSGDGGDKSVPLVTDLAGDIEDLDQAVFLSAVSLAIDGAVPVARRQVGAGGFERVVQRRLVGLDLGDQDVFGVSGGLEGFF
jgi:hypothetical protein